MDWKKLVLAGIAALVAGFILFIPITLITELSINFSVGYASLLLFLVTEMAGGSILYGLLKRWPGIEFGDRFRAVALTVIKIWLIGTVILFALDVVFVEPLVQKQIETYTCPPNAFCAFPPHPFQYFAIILFAMPSNPLFFLPGAYLARRFLKW